MSYELIAESAHDPGKLRQCAHEKALSERCLVDNISEPFCIPTLISIFDVYINA